MFTGIIQGKGEVIAFKPQKDHCTASMQIALPQAAQGGIKIGASVAINGCCLTVTHIERNIVSFDLIAETLRRTNLGTLQKGDLVNVERSLKMGDELGGHHVSGHIFTTAPISAIHRDKAETEVTLSVNALWAPYVFEKGFIALDGCSLTVGETGKDFLKVYLIPETLRLTVFNSRKVGDKVNVELDRETQTLVDTMTRVVKNQLVIKNDK